jgi:hypothetical protein
LNKNVPVIPILLQGIHMPPPSVLPDSLQDLSRRNAIQLNDDHWFSDCKLLAGILKNTLHVSRSLNEGKIRRYRLIVFALSALVTLLTVLLQISSFEFTFGGLLYAVLSLLLGLAVVGNVALVTYLLGSIKKELDRLSWAIIIIAVVGALAVGWGSPYSNWAPVLMILVAGLLNFVEPDE